MPRDQLVLIDGHALAYRMFYALPLEAFSTRAGEPTNATYGFTRSLMDLILADDPPEYLAVSFDTGKTFRDDIYPEYKATRAKTPDELHIQVDRIRQVVQAFNVPVLEMEGYEADDVLGTIARQAAAHGVEIRILTGDRDLLQLVDEQTRVLLAGRKGTEEYDPAAVLGKLGVRADQVVDYKAIVGDSSDNIPGVRGVGEKTAVKLLAEYATLDGVYAHVEEIASARFRKALVAARDEAYLSQDLARIRTDLPMTLDLEACRTVDFDREVVAELMRELEFQSLGDRFRSEAPAAPRQLSLLDVPAPAGAPSRAAVSSTGGTDVHLVTDPPALEKLVRRLGKASLICFDTETTGVDEMTADLVGIALSPAVGEGYYIPVGHTVREEGVQQMALTTVLEALRDVLQDPSIPKVAHNAKYDLTILQRYGLTVSPVWFDTMLAAWLLDPAGRGLGLKNQAWVQLGVEMTEISQLIGQGAKQITMAQVPIKQAAAYAAADVDMPLRLVEVYEPKLREMQLWHLFSDVEMPLVPVISEIERAGVALDAEYLRGMSGELALRLDELTGRIYELAGRMFNINSTQQLSQVLFEDLQLPTQGLRKTKSGHYSTAAGVLESLMGSHEIIQVILEHREVAKLKSTYVDALPEMVNPRDRPYPHVLQSGGRHHRPVGIVESKPAEHTHPDRAGTPDSARICGRTWVGVAGGRLFPGRATRTGSHLPGSRSFGCVSARPRHPCDHRRGGQ